MKANRIIEEFMLAANQTVAEEYFWSELPFVYRTHETPDMEKIQNLALFIENFGYTLKIKEDFPAHKNGGNASIDYSAFFRMAVQFFPVSMP